MGQYFRQRSSFNEQILSPSKTITKAKVIK